MERGQGLGFQWLTGNSPPAISAHYSPTLGTQLSLPEAQTHMQKQMEAWQELHPHGEQNGLPYPHDFYGPNLQQPKSPDSRRKASRFSEEATAFLTEQFNINPYPDKEEVSRIAAATNLSSKQVRVWLTNRRRRTSPQGLYFRSDQRHISNIQV